MTFNPLSPGTLTRTTLDTDYSDEPASLVAVACASARQCTALVVGGVELTFDPESPGIPTSVPAASPLSALACTSASQCVAVGGSGETTFNPDSSGLPTSYTVDGAYGLSAVACPSASQCTAVGSAGAEVTFNATSPGTPTSYTIDSNTALYAVACASTTQCTAVDNNGGEVTFNPTSPGAPARAVIDSVYVKLSAVACPSATQCTAVDSSGGEVTFNPASPGTPTPVTIDGTTALYAVACPSATQCTAVDGGGSEVTFNPSSPGSPVPVMIDGGDGANGSTAIYAIACPSSSQCTAVDGGGGEVTFKPASPGTPARVAIDSPYDGKLSAVACPSVNLCVAVGGDAVEGSPIADTWTVDEIPLASPSGVACASSSQCVAVDTGGLGSVGTASRVVPPTTTTTTTTSPTTPTPQRPVNTSPPVITGTPAAGRTLTCSTGTWDNDPTKFTYQWNRNGTVLFGTTRSTYAVGTLDEGTSLTCTVTAANAAGSASAVSLPVRVPIPRVRRCPGAAGEMTGTTIGQIQLGMTRGRARYLYRRHSDRGKRYEDFFCLTPIGVRVGYASPKLLDGLSKRERAGVRGRVVWASTSDPYYSLDGIRPGESIATAARVLGTEPPFHIGLNYWYLARKPTYTAVLKVRGGVVEELGIATNALTQTRTTQGVLMHSFY